MFRKTNNMTRQEIIQQTNRFLTSELDIDEQLTADPDTELKRDIGISSVDAVAIMTFAQKTFDCTITLPAIKAIITLSDLYDYIEKTTSKQ